MTAVWCSIGYYLMSHSFLADRIRRIGHVILPFVLIGLGIYRLILDTTTNLLFSSTFSFFSMISDAFCCALTLLKSIAINCIEITNVITKNTIPTYTVENGCGMSGIML